MRTHRRWPGPGALSNCWHDCSPCHLPQIHRLLTGSDIPKLITLPCLTNFTCKCLQTSTHWVQLREVSVQSCFILVFFPKYWLLAVARMLLWHTSTARSHRLRDTTSITMLPKYSLLSNLINFEHLINPISPFKSLNQTQVLVVKQGLLYKLTLQPQQLCHQTGMAGTSWKHVQDHWSKPGKGTSTLDTDTKISRILLQREKKSTLKMSKEETCKWFFHKWGLDWVVKVQ